MAPATKRAAAQPPKGSAGRPAKVAKSAPVAEVDDKFAPAFELLAELNAGVPASCIEMLTAALPHALEASKENRHNFQETVLSGMAEICQKEQAKRESRIAEGEANLAAQETAKAGAAAKVDAAATEEEARRAQKEAAAACVASGVGAAGAAAGSLAEARTAAAEAEAAAEQQAKGKEDFMAKVQELFPPLKEGAWAKKDWRQRQKAIGQFMGLFAGTKVPQSLTAALPLALKDAPGARGMFAGKVVEEGEKVLKEHSVTLEEAIGAAKATAAERLEDLARAEKLEKDAVLSRDLAQEECIEKENEWLAAEEVLAGLKKSMADFPEEDKRLATELDEAKTALQTLKNAIDQFKLLESPPPVATELPQEVVAPAAGAEDGASTADAPMVAEVEVVH